MTHNISIFIKPFIYHQYMHLINASLIFELERNPYRKQSSHLEVGNLYSTLACWQEKIYV